MQRIQLQPNEAMRLILVGTASAPTDCHGRATIPHGTNSSTRLRDARVVEFRQADDPREVRLLRAMTMKKTELRMESGILHVAND